MRLGDSEAVLFGFTLATASTVVLLRAVEERGLIKTDIGRIPVGWLLVEDVVIILALVAARSPASLSACRAARSARAGSGSDARSGRLRRELSSRRYACPRSSRSSSSCPAALR